MASKKHVLVVDDAEDSAELTANILMLTLVGEVTVAIAHDGVEAVESALRQPPDVIVLDLGMPRMNGVEAATILRKSFVGSQPLLIALTGNASLHLQDLQSKVFDHVLEKPEGIARVVSLVEAAPLRSEV